MYSRFAALLQEKGISPYKVSTDTGISQSTLSDWKMGRHQPNINKLICLANYLDVDLEYLVGKSDIKKRETSPEELKFYQTMGTEYHEKEIKSALRTITSALNNQPRLTEREKRLLQSFGQLPAEMQDKCLDLIEAAAKNSQPNS